MEIVIEQALKAAFYLASGAILMTFFVLTFVEGILSQTTGYPLVSIVFYFIAMTSLGAAFWTYMQAKKVLRTLN